MLRIPPTPRTTSCVYTAQGDIVCPNGHPAQNLNVRNKIDHFEAADEDQDDKMRESSDEIPQYPDDGAATENYNGEDDYGYHEADGGEKNASDIGVQEQNVEESTREDFYNAQIRAKRMMQNNGQLYRLTHV